jgi:HAD superfamily hydrolase (TIGR01484 family)
MRLFIADLDGCIAHPFASPDWEAITELRRLIRKGQAADHENGIPRFTICTGRPMPYAEAVAQWLSVDLPIIFESGGGLYDVRHNHIEWTPSLTEERLAQIEELKSWLQAEIIPQFDGLIPEFTKRTDVGLVHPRKEVIDAVYPQVKRYVLSEYPEFVVHYTDVSINVLLSEFNKGTGVQRLSELLDIPLEEMAYIGDGTNDIPAMELVGHPFAPANARDEVKRVSGITVMEQEATRAVLGAFRRILNV